MSHLTPLDTPPPLKHPFLVSTNFDVNKRKLGWLENHRNSTATSVIKGMTILAPDATGGTSSAYSASRKIDSTTSSQNSSRGGVVSGSSSPATGAGDNGLVKDGRATPPPGGALGSAGGGGGGNGGIIDVDLSG